MSNSDFIRRLKSSLADRGMKLTDLAAATGINYHQIHTWTRRENSVPNAKSLDAVAKALGVTPDYLMYGTPMPQQDSGILAELNEQLNFLTEAELRVLLAAAKEMRGRQGQPTD